MDNYSMIDRKQTRLAIIGAGELGKLIAYHAVQDGGHTAIGFYDDFKKGVGPDGLPVLGAVAQILPDYKAGKFDALMIGIGYNHMKIREGYLKEFKGKIPFLNLIHSSSYIDPSVIQGEGIFVLPGVTIDAGVVLHDNILINAGAIVAHHTSIGDNTFIAPGATIAGLVQIGKNCFIGIGSTILDCLNIASCSTIGAGAVVTKDTKSHSVSIGVPAKIIRYNPE
jgi:sugar O-acyltransferase (sialic acid O-acetyltransferase NeuD family)